MQPQSTFNASSKQTELRYKKKYFLLIDFKVNGYDIVVLYKTVSNFSLSVPHVL